MMTASNKRMADTETVLTPPHVGVRRKDTQLTQPDVFDASGLSSPEMSETDLLSVLRRDLAKERCRSEMRQLGGLLVILGIGATLCE